MKEIYPAFKVVPSLGRLMQSGISKGDSFESFSKVFDMAVHMESSRCFHNDFEEIGSMENVFLFMNFATAQAVECNVTPRRALTTADYLAGARDQRDVVLLADMYSRAYALREVLVARVEVLGRSGFPPYMYSDLSTIVED